MTKTFEICNVQVRVVRTGKKARVLSPDNSEIVTRNIWAGDDGNKYVQYKGEFHQVGKSTYYTHDYFM